MANISLHIIGWGLKKKIQIHYILGSFTTLEHKAPLYLILSLVKMLVLMYDMCGSERPMSFFQQHQSSAWTTAWPHGISATSRAPWWECVNLTWRMVRPAWWSSLVPARSRAQRGDPFLSWGLTCCSRRRGQRRPRRRGTQSERSAPWWCEHAWNNRRSHQEHHWK